MQNAIDTTHELLQDMGAKVAPAKSFIFSNNGAARRWYQHHTWKHIGGKIPTVKHCRDLGGTINTTAKQHGAVINSRITNALTTLRKFRFLPQDASMKAHFIQSKVLAGAMYGIECIEP